MTKHRDRGQVVLPDGAHAYIEPQNVHRMERGFALIGVPTYRWEVSPLGEATLAAERSFLGASVGDGTVGTIPLPPGAGRVDWVLSTVLTNGRIAMLLPEVTAYFTEQGELIRMIYGEYDGSEWVVVETLPPPPYGRLSFGRSSRLVSVGNDVAWTVPTARSPSDADIVLLYQRTDGAWDVDSVFGGVVERAILHASPEHGLRVGVVGPDAGFTRSPFRLGVGGPDTSPLVVHVPEPGGRVRRPRLVDAPGGLAVTWIVESAQGWSAWVATELDAAEPVAPRLVDDNSLYAAIVVMAGGRTVAVTEHAGGIDQRASLRVHRLDGEGARQIGSIPSPYSGYFAAVAGDGHELYVIGPQFDAESVTPFVRSLVLRLEIPC